MNKTGFILGLMTLFTFSASQAVIYQVDNSQKKELEKNQIYMDKSVITIIQQDPGLQKLAQALEAAELEMVLQGPGPFTIFAPNDQAFEKLGDQFTELMKPENRMKLRKILLYEIVPGRILSTDLQTTTLPTPIGKDLNVEVTGSKIKVNNATIVEGDIEGRNGVIHVIDHVLIP